MTSTHVSLGNDGPDMSARMAARVEQGMSWLGGITLIDYIFGALLMVEMSFGLPLPVNQIVLVCIIVRGIFSRPQWRLTTQMWLVPLLVVTFWYLAMLSVVAEPSDDAYDWKRRLLRLILTAAFLIVIASGRAHLRSLLLGATTALVINVPLWVVGLGAGDYEGYLTGFLADKNVSGLAYCVVGVLMLLYAGSWSTRVPLLLFFGAALWLSGSRTSMTAFAIGVIWVIVGPRLTLLGRWLLAALSVLVVNLLAEDYSKIGRFSDRVGSDLLRERIGAASEIKARLASPWGLGLGESYVTVGHRSWFFHNSYLAAITEGGYPWLIVILLITVFIALRPFATGKLSYSATVAQAAAFAILICAWRLGEVFFTHYWALVIACGIVAIQERMLLHATEDDLRARGARNDAT